MEMSASMVLREGAALELHSVWCWASPDYLGDLVREG